MGDVYIGTSGWHYKHWKGPFYPEKMPASQMLAFYMERFRTRLARRKRARTAAIPGAVAVSHGDGGS